jgi:hypothetical protein
MASMVPTTSATTLPPLTATLEADTASWLAWRALSAFCLTVLVSSSIDAAVSSRELACSSVRDDKSWLPAAIWLDAVAMVSVPWRTSPTTLARLSFMSLSACISWPVSSLLLTSMSLVRSPAATAWAICTARDRGRVMLRTSSQARTMPRLSDSTLQTTSSRLVLARSSSLRRAASSSALRSVSTICCTPAR